MELMNLLNKTVQAADTKTPGPPANL
jgi:hypothetical protein